MKITVPKKSLLTSLGYVIGATTAYNVNPKQSHVLFQLDKKKLTLLATNYEIQITSSFAAKAEEKLKRLVPASKLNSVLRSLDDVDKLHIDFKENSAQFKAGDSVFSLMTQSADDFTCLGKEGDFEEMGKLEASDLQTGFQMVRYAASDQSHRMMLNGILLEGDQDKLSFIATDGHRMAVKTLSVGKKTEVRRIIPKRSVELILQHLDDVESVNVSVSDRVVKFETNQFEFISNVIDEKYPDYRSVIPRNNDKKALVERKKMLACMKRAIALSDKNAVVMINFDTGKMSIESSSKDNDNFAERLEVKYESEKLEIGFNVSFLTEMLNVVKEDILEIQLLDSRSGVLIKPVAEEGKESSFLYVIMPVRV